MRETMPPNNRTRKPPANARGNAVLVALRRQFGPLPAWAWALVGGISLYLYRRRSGATPSAPASTDTTTPDASATNTGAQQPVTTLDPGQAIYDPNTGKLLGNAPDQQAPPDANPPVTLDPGQTIYDPNTGRVFGPVGKVPHAPTKKPHKGKSKHTPKPKHQHEHNGKVVPAPGHHQAKPRKGASTKDPTTRKPARQMFGGMKPKARALATANSKLAKGLHKPEKAAPVKAPVMRQRTVAPAATHPATQKVTKAPPAPPRAAPKPAPKPAPKAAPKATAKPRKR